MVAYVNGTVIMFIHSELLHRYIDCGWYTIQGRLTIMNSLNKKIKVIKVHTGITSCSKLMMAFVFSLFCFYDNFFREVLGLQQNWEEGTEISHVLPGPPHAQPPPLSISFIRMVIFTKNEPILVYYNHSKSIYDLRVHFWCCVFHVFGQKY